MQFDTANRHISLDINNPALKFQVSEIKVENLKELRLLAE